MENVTGRAPGLATKPIIQPHVSLLDVFSPSECDSIVALGRQMWGAESRSGALGVTAERLTDETYRKSEIVWISHNRYTDWLFQKLFAVANQLNQKYWQFELAGSQRLQFTSYKGEGHYDWHMDLAEDAPDNTRKLSATVQLSDPADYDGGDLEINSGIIESAPRDRGCITLFPSYMHHRVTPVTRGERLSLVVWIVGERPFQ